MKDVEELYKANEKWWDIHIEKVRSQLLPEIVARVVELTRYDHIEIILGEQISLGNIGKFDAYQLLLMDDYDKAQAGIATNLSSVEIENQYMYIDYWYYHLPQTTQEKKEVIEFDNPDVKNDVWKLENDPFVLLEEAQK